MSDLVSFMRAIAAAPADEALRLVFADWLEERSDWRAEFLRLDCALESLRQKDQDGTDLNTRWEELWLQLSPSWRAVLGRPPIEKCELRFKFRCPLKWENLKPTEVAAVRFCQSCRKAVHYCHSIEEAQAHAEAGHCVAVDLGVRRNAGDLIGPGAELIGEIVL
jgi:uncharacterized protein (TIGR02996 family)